jgi:hypothetical protein
MAVIRNASRAGVRIVYHLAQRNLVSLVGAEAQLRTLTFSIFLLLISLTSTQNDEEVPADVVEDIRKAIYSLSSVREDWETANIHASQLAMLLDKVLERRGKGKSGMGSGAPVQEVPSFSAPLPLPQAVLSLDTPSSALYFDGSAENFRTINSDSLTPPLFPSLNDMDNFDPLDALSTFDNLLSDTGECVRRRGERCFNAC